jgi:hypothetical protein
MTTVCKAEDDFLEDKSIWFVDLSNGERIWMDDGRPGVEPVSAWRRLRIYLQENQLKIVSLYLKFRSHIEKPLPDNAAGYFFCNKALAFWGEDDTILSLLVGIYDGKGISIQEWLVPDLTLEKEEYRNIEQIIDPACLIINDGGQTYGETEE